MNKGKETKWFIYKDGEKKYDLVNRLENGFKTEKVHYKEYVGKKTTYDITVSNKNSNFFANGIVTHNCSMLLAARRHFRMLALMEDMMLIYRLERSMERRVYKIFVGALDDKDIPGYVEQIADQFKRTPIVDPLTGQLDLRKNILPVWKKTPIPLLDGRTITIEELAKEYNETSATEAPKKAASASISKEFESLKKHLSSAFQTKVQFSCDKQGKGKIAFPFKNEEELARLITIFDRVKGNLD